MICRPNSQWGDKTIFGSFLDTLAFTNTSFRTENNRIFYRQSFCRIIEYIINTISFIRFRSPSQLINRDQGIVCRESETRKVSLLTGIKGLSAGKVKPG